MEVYAKGEIKAEGVINNVKPSTMEKLRAIRKADRIIGVEVLQVLQQKGVSVWKVDLEGVIGLVPFAESGLEIEAQMKGFVGRKINVKVVKLSDQPEYAVLSRQKALWEMRDLLFAQTKVNDVIQGSVVGVGDNNVYVELGGCTAKVDRNQATYSKGLFSLRRLYNVGDVVDVKVLEVDHANREIKVSIIDAQENPWKTIGIKEGDVIVGRISNIIDSNRHDGEAVKLAFMEHIDGSGVEALVTMTTREAVLNIGDRIQAKVTRFKPDQQKFRVRFIQKIGG